MKNKCLLILLSVIVFSISPLAAQIDTQSEIDSLNVLLSKSKILDEKKSLLKTLSNRYQDKGNWEKYEEVVKQMLLLQEIKVDSFYLAETYNKLGISNCLMGNNKQALEYFSQALEINIAQKMPLIVANSYENMGTVYKDMGDYENAFNCQLKALEIRKDNEYDRLFNSYLKLATIQQLIGDSKKEDYYLMLAKQELDKMDSVTPRNMALFYNELGNIYNKRKQYDSSLVFYNNVIHYSNQIGWMLGIAEGIGNKAIIYSTIGEIDSSIFYHKRSLELSVQIDDCMGVSEENLSLAELYQTTNKQDSVLFYANNALQKSNECRLLNEQSKVLKFISDYYKSQANFEQAYEYLKLHYAIEDSISSSDVKKNIAELETKYETNEKEQQIKILHSENQFKRQQIWLFIAAIVILVLAIMIGIIMAIRRKKENIQRQDMLKQQLLRSQMNPHFLFNALGSIQNFMLKNETKKAAGYLNNFALLTRNILEHSDQEFIPLSDEIETLRNYIELEKMRMKNNFEYELIYDEELEIDFINIPPMLIQPFVENAIKHGLNDPNNKGILEIRFEEKGNSLHIEVTDNGVGVNYTKANKKSKHRSMSMDIFEQRRLLLMRRTKQIIGLTITDRNSLNQGQTGTQVNIEIPIKS